MNLFLLASVDYPRMAQYVNSLYDNDQWVLTSETLGTHLADHLFKLNDQGSDPDPCLTDMIIEDQVQLGSFVPVMKDFTAKVLYPDNGIPCHCPMIILMDRSYYEHFYRQ